MSRRLILVLGIAGAVLLGIILALVVLAGGRSEPTVLATPTPGATGTPGPNAPPGDNESQTLERKIAEVEGNPILKALPHDTAFWSLEWGGSEGNVYVLLAKVTFSPGEDPQQRISQQRPYIEAFARDTGQPAGTYVIRYEPRSIERD